MKVPYDTGSGGSRYTCARKVNAISTATHTCSQDVLCTLREYVIEYFPVVVSYAL